MIINDQTLEQKLETFRAYLTAMKEQGLQQLADDTHNFVTIGNQIDALTLTWTGQNITKAVNALGWQKLHWLPSPSELSRQQEAAAAQNKHANEVNRILESFCTERPEFVKDDHNLGLLVEFCNVHHKGVIGDVQIRHFWRMYQDSPELHRLASNARPLPIGLSGYLTPKDRTEEERAEKKAQQNRVQTALKERAAFETAIHNAAKIVVDAPNGKGIRWGETSAARIRALEAAAAKWPQWSAECTRIIQHERSRFRF
jgi:hypothetical protein